MKDNASPIQVILGFMGFLIIIMLCGLIDGNIKAAIAGAILSVVIAVVIVILAIRNHIKSQK